MVVLLLLFLFLLFVSSLITWKLQIKGKQVTFCSAGEALGATVLRALGFSAIAYLPLLDQPAISNPLLFPVGAALTLFGIFCMVVATRELSKTEFYGKKGIPKKVVTTGPYSVIRHPANVGFISAFAGWSLVWGAVYSLYLVPVLIIGLVIESFWEEKNLEKEFGDEYREYKKKVGMFLPNWRHA